MVSLAALSFLLERVALLSDQVLEFPFDGPDGVRRDEVWVGEVETSSVFAGDFFLVLKQLQGSEHGDFFWCFF